MKNARKIAIARQKHRDKLCAYAREYHTKNREKRLKQILENKQRKKTNEQ